MRMNRTRVSSFFPGKWAAKTLVARERRRRDKAAIAEGREIPFCDGCEGWALLMGPCPDKIVGCDELHVQKCPECHGTGKKETP